jgi:hypothetical protein
MSEQDEAVAKIKAAHEQLATLHMSMVVDHDMEPIDFYNMLVSYTAYAGTALMPLGEERRSTKAMAEAYAKAIKGWLADPDVRASRAAALGGPSTTH